MSNYNKLVEQVRELERNSRLANDMMNTGEVMVLVSKLADAVERLQELNKRLETEANKHRDIASEAIGRMTDAEHREKKLADGIREERDAARARVAALETAARKVTSINDTCGARLAQAVGELAAALADGRVPSTGQETT